MDRQALLSKETLTVHEAALLIASPGLSAEAAEMQLSHAIDRGELAASITRWATEQWDGERLEGNIDRARTRLARCDLDRWLGRSPD